MSVSSIYRVWAIDLNTRNHRCSWCVHLVSFDKYGHLNVMREKAFKFIVAVGKSVCGWWLLLSSIQSAPISSSDHMAKDEELCGAWEQICSMKSLHDFVLKLPCTTINPSKPAQRDKNHTVKKKIPKYMCTNIRNSNAEYEASIYLSIGLKFYAPLKNISLL